MFSRHRHVRVERVGLEHHGDAALVRGDVVHALAVEAKSPAVIDSSPAIIRSSVDFPQPRRADETANSPSSISMSTPRMTSSGAKATCGCL